MTKTVKVGLEVKEQPYVAGMGRAAKATERVADAADDATKSATELAAGAGRAQDSVEDLGDSAKGAARGLGDLRQDAERLDRQIDETTRGIRDLAREIARTSDEATRADLATKLTGERGKLRGQVDLRKLIDFGNDDDSDGLKQGLKFGARFAAGVSDGLAKAGGPISAGLSSVFGSLPPQAQAAIGAGVVGAVAAAGPLIGGVLSAAVVGGVGIGGVVGGIAAASQHPAVKAAATETGTTFAETMERASRSFVPVIVDSLGVARAEIAGWEDDFERIFSKSARFVAPLTKGALGFVDNLLPGVEAAIDRAGPIIDELASWGPELGDLLGDMFEEFGEHAADGARALAMFWTIFEAGVRMVVGSIATLTAVYGWLEKVSALLIGDIAHFAALSTVEQGATEAGDGLSITMQELLAAFGGAGDAAAVAAVEVETLTEMVKRLTDTNISAEEANIALEAAMDRAAEAGKKNNDGIDAGTEKGRANREMLIGLARATGEAAAATMEQTGSQELASDVTERGRAAFLRAADAMGVGSAEAKRLADQLFGIPAKRDVVVTVNTAAAEAAARALVARINGMHARISVSAIGTTSYGGGAHTGEGNSTGMRWGGVRVHAAEGVLREAQIASPTSPARYAWAEPATGGEAFIPRRGNRGRSLDILETAAGWYGKSLASQPAYASRSGGSTTVVHNNTYNVAVAVSPTADAAEVGRVTVGAIQAYENRSGKGWRQ